MTLHTEEKQSDPCSLWKKVTASVGGIRVKTVFTIIWIHTLGTLLYSVLLVRVLIYIAHWFFYCSLSYKNIIQFSKVLIKKVYNF